MTEQPGAKGPNPQPEDEAFDPLSLTASVAAARAGLRSAVGQLLIAIKSGELLIPLAKPIAGAQEGQRMELSDELSLSPHLLVDDEDEAHVVVFTEPELAEPIATSVGWTTGDGAFSCVRVPALLALDVALELLDEHRILGLVVNPGHSSELLLRRNEVASLRQGRAIPLVGYVQQLAPAPDEETLEATPGGSEIEALKHVLNELLGGHSEVESYELKHTFNPERDLEPHPTLIVRVASAEIDREALGQSIMNAIETELPPPGYIDILFEMQSDET